MKRVSRKELEAAAALRTSLRAFLSRTNQITRRHGLTAERYELLLLIKISAEGEATVGKLAQRLCIGQSAATQLARRTEDLGLIERTVSSRDGRIHPLRLTTEGERRLTGAAAALHRERVALASVLTDVLPAWAGANTV